MELPNNNGYRNYESVIKFITDFCLEVALNDGCAFSGAKKERIGKTWKVLTDCPALHAELHGKLRNGQHSHEQCEGKQQKYV
jgi:hypothetical protein